MFYWLFPGLLILASAAGAAALHPANPQLAGETVYVTGTGIVRFHLQRLEPLWTALEEIQTDAAVATESGAVLVGTSRGLYALSPEDGSVLWRLPSRARLFSPTIQGDIAYAGGTDGLLRAVDTTTGTLLWQREFPGWIYPPAIAGQWLVTGGQPHRLYGLDAASGKLLWEMPLNQELVHRPVASGDGTVIITTFAGEILAVAPDDGSLRWQVRDSVINLSPAVAGGRLFFRTFGGWLKARRQSDSALLWSVRLQGPVTPPVRVQGSRVWTSDGAGAVLALEAATGRQLQRTPISARLLGSPIVADGRVVVFMTGGVSTIPQPVVVQPSTVQPEEVIP